jgi:hypothetical protein
MDWRDTFKIDEEIIPFECKKPTIVIYQNLKQFCIRLRQDDLTIILFVNFRLTKTQLNIKPCLEQQKINFN